MVLKDFFEDIQGVLSSALRVADTARIFTTSGLEWMLNLDPNNKGSAAMLRKSFERLGATYIKLGQLIASAPGLFPKEYVREMQTCLDNVNPVPFSEMKKILDAELGDKLDELFSSIDETPLASASIAQVHAAKLKNGEEVVIKIQRPGIAKKLKADLNLLYVAAYLFEKLAPGGARTSLTGIVQDFGRTIMEEVDFLQEAKNIEEFEDFLMQIKEKQVVVPRVHHDATTMRVLTMERFYGVALTDLESIKKLVKNPEETLVTALNTWFQSLLICGFFHADVHAGNLMVLNNGKLGFIDFGIVGRIEKNVWNGLMSLMQALSTQDWKLLASALVEVNATNVKVDEEKFASQLETMFQGFFDLGNDLMKGGMMNGNIDEAKINELMIGLVEISEENGLRIPREFALLFKQMLYFDRYIRLLAPELDMINSDKIHIQPDPKLLS